MTAVKPLVTALCALVLTSLSLSPAYAADELSAPDVVAAGQQFPVAWLGDITAGDKVTIAEPNAPADERVSAQNMGDTNSITIMAPFEPGTYELRYMSGQSIRESQRLEVVGGISSGTGTGTGSGTSGSGTSGTSGGSGGAGSSGGGGGTPVPVPEDDEHTYSKVLLLLGYQLEQTREAGRIMANRRQKCQEWRVAMPTMSMLGHMTEGEMRRGMTEIDPPLAMLLMRVEGLLLASGIDIFEDYQTHLGTAEKALCDSMDEDYFGHFAITYAHCRMTMDTPTQSMDIHIPPGSPSALMQAVDFEKGEAVSVDLARDMQRTLPVTGSGWSNSIAMTPMGGHTE